jgi:hypothetical protein
MESPPGVNSENAILLLMLTNGASEHAELNVWQDFSD